MAVPVLMPRQGQSVETCIITEWFIQKGQSVKKGEKLFIYETDKASFEEEAPADGILLEVFFQSGDEVPVLTNVAVIGAEGENTEQFRPANQESFSENKAEEKVESTGKEQVQVQEIIVSSEISGEIKISPRARNLAEKLKIDFRFVKGTGPYGRIIEKDIENAAASGIYFTNLSQNLASVSGMVSGGNGSGIGGRVLDNELGVSAPTAEDSVVKKISNIRKIIAQNMQASISNSAQLTHHLSADARKIMQYRSRYKYLYEQGKSPNITLNDLVCFAVIKALKAKPEINAHFLGDSMRSFSKVHLGFAVQTDRGLMVPTLRNADDLSISELSERLKNLANDCKKGSIAPELLASTSASFTVSNLGAYGIEMFTPVINLPQCGILGVNTIINRPAYDDKGFITLIPFIGLSLTYDHRALDGAPASDFLREIKLQIEELTE